MRRAEGFDHATPLPAAELASRVARLGVGLVHVAGAAVSAPAREDHGDAELVCGALALGRDAARLSVERAEMMPGLLGSFGDGGAREVAARATG